MPSSCIKVVDGIKRPPELMKRYANGTNTPKRPRKKCGGIDFVNRIEEVHSNTKHWLEHPLWGLIQKKSLSLHQIHTLMKDCNTSSFSDFFSETSTGGFGRNYIYDFRKIKFLSLERNSLDALGFLMGLLREAQIRTDVRQHRMSVTTMVSIFPAISTIAQIEPFAGDLFDSIEHKFFRVAYLPPDGGAEIAFKKSWREKHTDLASKYPTSDCYLSNQSASKPINFESLTTKIK